MRKPRDYDAELQSLTERAALLKDRKVRQLGELVMATGADRLDIETLAGALVASASAPADVTEGWRRQGQSFFRGKGRTGGSARGDAQRAEASDGADTAGRAGPVTPSGDGRTAQPVADLEGGKAKLL